MKIKKYIFSSQIRGDSYQQTPEQEILALQKELQNLPDLDSPSHVFSRRLPLDSFATANAEFTPVTRPRSRSMPRVTYESNRYLTLPDSFPFNCQLPRGRSAGTLGFQVIHYINVKLFKWFNNINLVITNHVRFL